MQHTIYLWCRWSTDVENASLQYYNGNTILFNEITLLTVVIFKTPFFFSNPVTLFSPFSFLVHKNFKSVDFRILCEIRPIGNTGGNGTVQTLSSVNLFSTVNFPAVGIQYNVCLNCVILCLLFFSLHRETEEHNASTDFGVNTQHYDELMMFVLKNERV
jgi:hypothetical protein